MGERRGGEKKSLQRGWKDRQDARIMEGGVVKSGGGCYLATTSKKINKVSVKESDSLARDRAPEMEGEKRLIDEAKD